MTLARISPHTHVATTQKMSMLADLEQLQQRVSKALKGDIKFLDANQKQVVAAAKKLTEAYGLLTAGLIPSNQE